MMGQRSETHSSSVRTDAVLRATLSADTDDDAHARPHHGRLSRPVRRAIDYLEVNYMDPVTLRQLETVTARNVYQIIRAFRRDLGITPHAFLMQLRVERATSLMVDGEPIAGAAAEAGFVDQSHFTKHFKRVHGLTPRQFLLTRVGHA